MSTQARVQIRTLRPFPGRGDLTPNLPFLLFPLLSSEVGQGLGLCNFWACSPRNFICFWKLGNGSERLMVFLTSEGWKKLYLFLFFHLPCSLSFLLPSLSCSFNLYFPHSLPSYLLKHAQRSCSLPDTVLGDGDLEVNPTQPSKS